MAYEGQPPHRRMAACRLKVNINIKKHRMVILVNTHITKIHIM